MTDGATRFSEATVTACLEDLDWGRLDQHLAAFTLDGDAADKLIGLVLRARRLIFRYPGNLKKRTAILHGVVAKVQADLGDEAADAAAERFEVFALIDEGYAGLRTMIEGLPLAGFSQAEQVSAYLGRVAHDWNDMQRKVEAAGAARSLVLSSVMLETDDGHRYGVDAATSMLVNLLGMNVLLAAYKDKWFDSDDLVRLPELPTVTAEQIAQASAAHNTAIGWQQWQLIEERCRYIGGKLEKRPAADGEGAPAGSDVMVHSPEGIEWEMLDTIANERLGERLGQTFQDMCARTDLLSKGQGIDPGTPMPPLGYVSPEEMHSAVMLSEFIGLNAATLPVELGGLRLCEWMRGFAVLQRLAGDAVETATDPFDRAFPRMTIADLEAVLQRNGLVDAKARVFIDHASYAKSSRDVYDAPILRGEGDWCLLAVPALYAAMLIRLVLSTLSNKGFDIEGKGEAFEEQFRSVLKEEHLPVYHFEVKRAGQTYEYDAIVPWGLYLFVFECKNRSLSGTNPIASFNFLRSTLGHVEQVERLVQALRDHPDILTSQVKEDCSSLSIVPVVVSSMPFSTQGAVENVYFNDVGAINRFFSERYTHVSRLHHVGTQKLLHRVRLHDLWDDETPDAEAFMRHLEKPHQLDFMLAHMSVEAAGMQLGPALYAYTRIIHRKEMTMESMAALAGKTAEAIEADMEQFAQGVAQARAKIENEQAD